MSCKSIEFQESPPFQINYARYNQWTGGQPGVSGINVLIQYQSKQQVAFDSIFFQSKKGHIEYHTENGKNYLIGRISTSLPITVNLREDPKKKTEEKPLFQLEDHEAVLMYTYQNKTYYYKLSNLEKTDTLFFD